MKIFNPEILNKAIISIFKNKSDFFSDRKQLADLIIKDHEDFFKNIKEKREEEFELLLEDIKIKKVSISKAVEKLRIFNQSYYTEKKLLVNIKGDELFKEYSEKYKKTIVIKGFENTPSLTLNPAVYKESLKYEKEYLSGSFVICFFFNEDENSNNIGISVRQKNGHVLNSIINLGVNNKEMVLSSFNISHKNLHLELNSRNEFANKFLSSLKEEDLLTLDSKEKEDFFSMIFDFKLDLKDDPLYEVFKIGLNDFINTVKNELKQKNTLKI